MKGNGEFGQIRPFAGVVHVHFRLIFQSQNIDYFTPNQQSILR